MSFPLQLVFPGLKIISYSWQWQRKFNLTLARGEGRGSTVVTFMTHDLKIVGSKPTSGKRRKKVFLKLYLSLASGCNPVAEQSTRNRKTKGSNHTASKKREKTTKN